MNTTVALDGVPRRLEELRLQDFLQCFQFGAGFFETFLLTEGEPMFLERHLARLRESLAAHAPAVRAPAAELLAPEAVRETLRRCLEADDALGPRFTGVGKLVAGDGHLLLMFRPLPPNHEQLQREGRSLDELEERSYRRGEPSLNHKSLAYLRQFTHMERMPLFLNEAGEVCEVPTGNLFLLLGEALVTPPLDAPCLPGVVRAVLREVGRVGRWPVEERPVHRAQLEAVRGCFMTNSVSLALPVPRLLGRSLPESVALAAAAREAVWAQAHRTA
ncbi:MAG TPA: aminotransferase class IV [Myxococcaceae bacterium]|nr:aminotransferase class IV [Myxococcaceae bacterium]